MKKFLSILLALAVGFTFTFGSAMSAFAAKPTDADAGNFILTEAKVVQNINDTYNNAKKDLDKSLEDALAAIFGKDTEKEIDGIKVYKTAVEKVYKEKIYDVQLAELDKNKATALNEVSTAIGNANVKDYNGNFVIPAGINDSNPGEKATDWQAAGYAVYLAKWETEATYLTSAITAEITSAKYEAVFKDDGTGTGNAAVAKATYNTVKDAAETAIRAIDLNAYSKEYNGGAKSNYDKAVETTTTALRVISEAAPAVAAPAWADYKTAINAISRVYTAPVNQGNATGFMYTSNPWNGTFADTTPYSVTGLNYITKIADEPTEATKLEYAQNKVISQLTNDINTWKNSVVTAANNTILEESLKAKPVQKNIDDAKEAIANAEASAAAAIEIVTYLAKDCEDIDDLLASGTPLTARAVNTTMWVFTSGASAKIKAHGYSYNMNATTGPMNDVLDVVNHIADLKKEAEIKKATIQIDGTTLVEIEKALEDAIDATYKGTAASLSVGDAVTALYRTQTKLMADATVKVNNRTYNGVGMWDNSLTSLYDKDYYDAVRKVMDDTNEAIKAAKTVADAEAAFLKGVEALDAVPTVADKRQAQSTKEFSDLLKQYKKELTEYANYKESLIKAADYSWAKNTMVGNLIDNLEATYTVDALKAAYTEAKTELDNLKTKAEVQASAKEVSDKIAALPVTATVADKEAVAAARKALDNHNDYCKLIGDNDNKVTLISKLTNAEKAIKAAEIKAMKDAYTAIMKDGKVTTDEAAAVEQLRKDYDAYIAYYAGENAAPSEISALEAELNDIKIAGTEKALEDAQVAEVRAMIAKLPADGSDPAAVKAARAAYEALGRDAKHRVYTSSEYDKLVDAEKMIKFTAEDAKAYVQDLSIAVRTAKVGKKVKVTVKADVQTLIDNGYTVTYKFYKSTKKGSGYKNTVNKTTNTYTNTNPVKGKNYYKVKLVVKNAEGTVVATTPLTQCKYGVRTIK